MGKIATGVGVLLLALMLCAPPSLLAQGITTAGINGKVSASNGDPLPGVNVVALHVPSGSVYGVSTRVDGRYTLPNLRVGGPYTVSATMVGYQKQSRTDIYLRLGENLDLNFVLREEAVQAGEVVVVGQRADVFNASHIGASTNVGREQIDRLPTLSRNFQDYYKVSPYITGDKGNALGRNSRYNNIQIDGTNFNDLFGLGSTGAPAGQSNVTPISLDAIEEFQIVVSPYDVRQAGFTGAGVNAITRSGTNDYRGSVFYFGRDKRIAGTSPDSLKTKLSGFRDNQIGGRIGGPILQDKLFFFANAEMTRFNQPFSRTFGNQNLGTNAYTVNPDSLRMLTDRLKNTYGYDPGSYSDIGYNRESDKLFLRLDYNLAENHKLTARWSYLRSSEDNSPSRGRSVTDIYFDNGKYKLDDRTHSVALQLTSVFGNQASNEFVLGYVDQMDEPTYYGAAFPTLYIATKGTGTAYTGNQNLVLGAEEFRHYNLLGQKYFEITDNFTWYLQEHTLTFGARVDLLSFRNLFIADGFGAYTYGSIAQFLNDQRASSYTFRYSATSDPEQEANWGARQFGIYAQDEWKVSLSLKLTAGIRADIPTYPDNASYNFPIDSIFGYSTATPPKAQIALSPRLGFNWSMDETRTAQLRGGVGIFYGRFPYVWVSNQYSNTGVDFFTLTSAPTRFIPDPYGQPKSATTLPSAEVDLTDPNFKAPSVLRWNLALDYKLPYEITATAEGIFSLTLNDVSYKNINMKGLQDNAGLTPGGRLVGENREVWGVWNSTLRRFEYRTVTGSLSAGYLPVDNRFAPGVYLVTNVSKGSNSNITLQIQRNAPTGLNGTAAYTWGMAKDINSMNSTQAASGWRFNPTPGNPNDPQLTYSQWDRRHRILGAVSYRQDWGGGFVTDIGFFYNGQSGRPFSYMVFGDVNGDGSGTSLSNINDLAYIPKDVNDIILVNDAGTTLAKTDAAYTQLEAFINGDDYLKEHRGHMSERSGPREPWAHSIDMRLSQDIPVLWGHKIQITIDILNVLNLLKSDWGWIKNTGVNQTVNMFQFYDIVTSGADIGKPRYRWLGLKTTDGKADPFQPDNLLSRWQMQLGVRYTF